MPSDRVDDRPGRRVDPRHPAAHKPFRKELDSVRANLAGDPEAILASMRLLEDALRKTLSES